MPNLYQSLFYALILIFLYSVVIYCFFIYGSHVIIFFSLNSYFSLTFLIDNISVSCLVMLFLCLINVMPFVFHYGCSSSFFNLKDLILLFVVSMSFLVVSGNYMSSLIGWELLGVTSILLILYNCTSCSIRSCYITLVSSRLGDVGLFVLVAFDYTYFGNFNVAFLTYLLVIMTKSAIFPITTWLLEAMRAPTPVSSLVHSSTLVAAGVWFSLRYNLHNIDCILFWIILFCMFTITLSACYSLINSDLKQLIALSTCNNISWCVLGYFLGDVNLCLLFLIVHGVTKCLLFIIVGDILISSNHSQHSSNTVGIRYVGPMNIFLFSFLVLSFSGFPFVGIFFVKHLFIGCVVLQGNFILTVWMIINLFLTYCYSYRLFFKVICSFFGISCSTAVGFVVTYFSGVCPSLFEFFQLWQFDDLDSGMEYYSFINFIIIIIHLLGFLFSVFIFYGEDSVYPILSFWGQSLSGCSLLFSYFSYYLNLFIRFIYGFSLYWELLVLKFLHSRVCNNFSSSFSFIDQNILFLGIMLLIFFHFIISL